jgi:hypothetical protein
MERATDMRSRTVKNPWSLLLLCICFRIEAINFKLPEQLNIRAFVAATGLALKNIIHPITQLIPKNLAFIKIHHRNIAILTLIGAALTAGYIRIKPGTQATPSQSHKTFYSEIVSFLQRLKMHQKQAWGNIQATFSTNYTEIQQRNDQLIQQTEALQGQVTQLQMQLDQQRKEALDNQQRAGRIQEELTYQQGVSQNFAIRLGERYRELNDARARIQELEHRTQCQQKDIEQLQSRMAHTPQPSIPPASAPAHKKTPDQGRPQPEKAQQPKATQQPPPAGAQPVAPTAKQPQRTISLSPRWYDPK